MPRGLGEDPLTRQRKANRRAGRHSASVATASNASGGVSSVKSEAGERIAPNASSSRPASYNDVFFRKRSEIDAVTASVGFSQGMTMPAISASATAHQVASEPEPAEPPASANAAEPPAAAAPVPSVPVHEPVDSSPQLIPMAVPVVPAADAEVGQSSVRTEAQATIIEPHEGGFLKRLFGRLRK